MDPLWFETCWGIFKYFLILIVSTYDILCISSIIKCLDYVLSSAWLKYTASCVISGFRREVDEKGALLGYYAASSANS
jgi:hypothetical protein